MSKSNKYVIKIITYDDKTFYLESFGKGYASWIGDFGKAKRFQKLGSAFKAYKKAAYFAACKDSYIEPINLNN